MASFGAQLKQEREKRGISLEEISQSTKIGTRLLRALEDDHFDQLPGGIFNKGFIRAYARCVGLDEEQAIADYAAATGAAAAPEAEEAKKENGSEARATNFDADMGEDAASTLPWGLFAVVLLMVALGFAAWGFYSAHKNADRRSGSAKASPAPTESVSAPASASVSSSVSTSKLVAAQPVSHPVTVAIPPSPKPVTTAVLRTATDTQNAAAGLLLRITARQDSWISINVDGEVTMQNTLLAPAQKSIRAQKDIVIRAGNVGALEFELNGEKLPAQGAVGEVKTLTFDSHGVHALVPKPPSAEQIPQNPSQPAPQP